MDKNKSNSTVLNVVMGKGVNVTRMDEQFIISIGFLDFCRKRCEFFGNLIEGKALGENEKLQFKARRKSLRTLIAFLKNLVDMKGNDNPDVPDFDEAEEEIKLLASQGVIPELDDCRNRGIELLDANQMIGWRRNTAIPTFSPEQKIAEKVIATMESRLHMNRNLSTQNTLVSTPRFSQNLNFQPHQRYSNGGQPWNRSKLYRTTSVGTPSPSPTASNYSDEASGANNVIIPYLRRTRDDSFRALSEPTTDDEAARIEKRKNRKPISPPGENHTSKSPLIKNIIGDRKIVTGNETVTSAKPTRMSPANTHFSDDLNIDPKHRIIEIETDMDIDYGDQEIPIDLSITPDPDALNDVLNTETLPLGTNTNEDPDFAPQATCPDGDIFVCSAGCDDEFEWNAEQILDHIEQRHSIDPEEISGVLEGQILEIHIDMPNRLHVEGKTQTKYVKCFSRNKFAYELRGIEHENCPVFEEKEDQQLPFNPNRSKNSKWFKTTMGELFRVTVKDEDPDSSPEPNVRSSPETAHKVPTEGDESDTDESNHKSDSKGITKGKKKELSKRVVSDSEEDEPTISKPPPKRIFGCRTVADTTTNKIRKHEYLIGQKDTKVNKEYKDNKENWVTHDKIDYALRKYYLGKKECRHIALQIEENNAREQMARRQLQEIFPAGIRTHLDEFTVKSYEESNIKKIASNKFRLVNGVCFSNEEDDGVQNARPRICLACTEAFPGNNTSRHMDRCTYARKIEEDMIARRAAEHSDTIDPSKIVSDIKVGEVLNNLKNGGTREIAPYVSMYLEKIRQNLAVINIMCRTLYFEMLTLLSFDDCRNGGGEANRACLLLGELFNMMWMIIRMIPRREQQHRTVLAPEVKANIKERDDAGNQTEKSKEATRNNTRLVEGFGSGLSVNRKRQKLMEKQCNELLDARDKKKFATEQVAARSKAKRKDDENSNKVNASKTKNTDTGKADSNEMKSPDAKRAKRGSKESNHDDSSDLFFDHITGGGNKNKTLYTNQAKRTKSVSATVTSKSSETGAKEPSSSAAVKPNSTRATSTATSARTETNTSDTTPTKSTEPRSTRSTKDERPKSSKD